MSFDAISGHPRSHAVTFVEGTDVSAWGRQVSGHLFVTQGDLTSLACDAVLVPTGAIRSGGEVRYDHSATTSWIDGLGLDATPEGFLGGDIRPDRRVARVRAGGPFEPEVGVGLTGPSQPEAPAWYAQAVTGFVKQAPARDVTSDGGRPLGSPRPLLGVPLVGTGFGGMPNRKGEVINALVDAVTGELGRRDVDVVLVLADAAAYAAAQQARARSDASWRAFDTSGSDVADRLARDARQGRLVLFMGAGTSTGAGLPSWKGLLKALSARARLVGDELAELERMDARDAGVVIDRRLHDRGDRSEGRSPQRSVVSVSRSSISCLPRCQSARPS